MKTVSLVLILCASLFAQRPNIQTQLFTAPTAGTLAGQGTWPQGINARGTVAGVYVDSSNVAHGFTRTAAGVFTTVNGFNAKTGVTSLSGINASGQVIGNFTPPGVLPSAQSIGFLLSPGGKFVAIQAQLGLVATEPLAINDGGTICGVWTNFDGTGFHGFVRDTTGNLTSFDADPNSTNGTTASAINASGTIAGTYIDGNSAMHGFTRDPQGIITSFDPEGSTGTFAYSINASGQVAGYYFDAQNAEHLFVRNADGTFTTFGIFGAVAYDAPGSGLKVAINDSGETAGVATLNSGSTVAWTRLANGKTAIFQSCGQTGVSGLNNAGHFTGFCGGTDQQLSFDGFTF